MQLSRLSEVERISMRQTSTLLALPARLLELPYLDILALETRKLEDRAAWDS